MVDLVTVVGIFSVLIFILVSNKAPSDLAAFTTLLLFLLLGFIDNSKVFSGFSSPAVLTIIFTFVLAGGLRASGIAELLAERVEKYLSGSRLRTTTFLYLLTASLSAFMNNIAAVAIVLPAAAAISKRSGVVKNYLFLPISVAALLGGALTVIGTPPNIISSEILQRSLDLQLHFFDFISFGLPLLIVGFIFCLLFTPLLLDRSSGKEEGLSLTDIYGLRESLFILKVPKHSKLSGLSLSDTEFRRILSASVVTIIRKDKTISNPLPSFILEDDDRMIIRGRIDDLKALLRFQGSDVDNVSEQSLRSLRNSVACISFKPSEELTKKGVTLEALDLKTAFGLVVLGKVVGDDKISDIHAKDKILPGDRINCLIPRDKLKSILEMSPNFEAIEEVELRASSSKEFVSLALRGGSPIHGKTLAESRLGELLGATVLGALRNGFFHLFQSSDEYLLDGDRIIIHANLKELNLLSILSELELVSEEAEGNLESRTDGFVEMLLSPRSKLIGKTPREIQFRKKYDFQVAAVWRDGKAIPTHVADLKLKYGDGLLLLGPRDKFQILSDNPDFVSLSGEQKPLRPNKKLWTFVSLGILIVFSVFEIFPVHISAAIAALCILLSGSLTMEEVYREIDWKIIVLVGSLLSLGSVLEESGAMAILGAYSQSLARDLGSNTGALVFALSSSLLSQFLDASIAVVILAPLAIDTAIALGCDPKLYVIVTSIGASIAFLFPFSHRAHLLVQSAAGYKGSDFLKFGSLLSLSLFMTIWVILLLL